MDVAALSDRTAVELVELVASGRVRKRVGARVGASRSLETDTLSLEQVAQIFNDDLAQRGADFRFDLDRLEDPAQVGALGATYPEAVPVGAGVSMFEV